jgi:hypothetical protein
VRQVRGSGGWGWGRGRSYKALAHVQITLLAYTTVSRGVVGIGTTWPAVAVRRGKTSWVLSHSIYGLATGVPLVQEVYLRLVGVGVSAGASHSANRKAAKMSSARRISWPSPHSSSDI